MGQRPEDLQDSGGAVLPGGPGDAPGPETAGIRRPAPFGGPGRNESGGTVPALRLRGEKERRIPEGPRKMRLPYRVGKGLRLPASGGG